MVTKYKVTLTMAIESNIGPADAIERAVTAVNNYGTAGYPTVLAQVDYVNPVHEEWLLRCNPDRAALERT